MRLITTQTGRLRMDVCSVYVLENKEQRSSQMARFPGRRTAQRESTHEGPATKEFQSINNIKGDMMKVDRYHGMDRKRKQSKPFLCPPHSRTKHFTIWDARFSASFGNQRLSTLFVDWPLFMGGQTFMPQNGGFPASPRFSPILTVDGNDACRTTDADGMNACRTTRQ